MKAMWNRLLIFLHLRRDWANDFDHTPPAFGDVKPHRYDCEIEGKVLKCCAECGGGRLHTIHTDYVTPASGSYRPIVDRGRRSGGLGWM